MCWVLPDWPVKLNWEVALFIPQKYYCAAVIASPTNIMFSTCSTYTGVAGILWTFLFVRLGTLGGKLLNLIVRWTLGVKLFKSCSLADRHVHDVREKRSVSQAFGILVGFFQFYNLFTAMNHQIPKSNCCSAAVFASKFLWQVSFEPVNSVLVEKWFCQMSIKLNSTCVHHQ
jgi:hypothetical protein